MRSKDLIKYRQWSRKKARVIWKVHFSRPHLSLPPFPLQQWVNEIRTKCFVHYAAISNYIPGFWISLLSINIGLLHKATKINAQITLSSLSAIRWHERNQNYEINILNYDMHLLHLRLYYVMIFWYFAVKFDKYSPFLRLKSNLIINGKYILLSIILQIKQTKIKVQRKKCWKSKNNHSKSQLTLLHTYPNNKSCIILFPKGVFVYFSAKNITPS